MELNRPTVVDVTELARAFKAKPGNSCGGNLHLVLDDGNIRDGDIRFCLEQAETAGDQDGAALAKKLLQMTKTQRKKACWLANNRKKEAAKKAIDPLEALQAENARLRALLAQAQAYVDNAYEAAFPDEDANIALLNAIKAVLAPPGAKIK